MPIFALRLVKSDTPNYVCCADRHGRINAWSSNPATTCIHGIPAAGAKEIADLINGHFKSENNGARVKVEKIPTEVNWKDREAGRFKRGTYIPTPWDKLPWFKGNNLDHFAHISTESEARVAYTPDADYGASDRQLSIRPGKYLQKYFADKLSKAEIADLAATFCKVVDGELLFAKTPDEIEHVYTTGPSSCMSASADNYQSGIHPTRVYAGPDLAVAYLKRAGRITARAVCWPDKKLCNRIYGDTARMDPLMRAAGYSVGSNLEGARLAMIQPNRKKWRMSADRWNSGWRYIVPYLDGCGIAHKAGEFIVIGRGPSKHQYIAIGQSGVGQSTYPEDRA